MRAATEAPACSASRAWLRVSRARGLLGVRVKERLDDVAVDDVRRGDALPVVRRRPPRRRLRALDQPVHLGKEPLLELPERRKDVARDLRHAADLPADPAKEDAAPLHLAERLVRRRDRRAAEDVDVVADVDLRDAAEAEAVQSSFTWPPTSDGTMAEGGAGGIGAGVALRSTEGMLSPAALIAETT